MLTKRDKIKGIVAHLMSAAADTVVRYDSGGDYKESRLEMERLWKELDAELDTLLTSE